MKYVKRVPRVILKNQTTSAARFAMSSDVPPARTCKLYSFNMFYHVLNWEANDGKQQYDTICIIMQFPSMSPIPSMDG